MQHRQTGGGLREGSREKMGLEAGLENWEGL